MKECGTCKYFIPQDRSDKDFLLGDCKDAIERARKIVPFAINLEVTMVYSHGGRKCPSYEEANA